MTNSVLRYRDLSHSDFDIDNIDVACIPEPFSSVSLYGDCRGRHSPRQLRTTAA